MLPGRAFTLDEVVRIIRRRWLLIVLPLAFGTAAGVLAFRKFPLRYQSETVILVVPQRVPESYVKATDALSVQDRLRSLSEQIQTRAKVTQIIKDFGLYGQGPGDDVSESVLQRMREDIGVKFVVAELSFRLTYIHSDPRIAQKVTERLAALYMEENFRDRANVSRGDQPIPRF